MPLLHNQRESTFQCLGCSEYIAIPRSARSDPESFALYREEQTAEHEPCMLFGDVAMAQAARLAARRERRHEERRRRNAQGFNNAVRYYSAALILTVCCAHMFAQQTLPDAPKPSIPAFAWNAGLVERYNTHKGTFDLEPYTGIDYRLLQTKLRFTLSVSRSTLAGTYTVSGGLNYKLLEWR